ncbi:Major facilitator superfamily domain, general substrate transporter [Cynara cardunculus var. scolymus]|uniref:Major facilitator superfamily domain, general substrate transporter n=1 Tax=Cynara cardunculus var. scolymus TaxID=59895 RepID=A0A103XSP0_CYNCS|nr:Major facilitator superfamily domain, general substrate transporter [Cynara cardunculus var. scolymus]
MDSMSIRVPYKNFKHDADDNAEVEMMKFEEEANRRFESDNSNIFSNGNASSSSSPSQGPPIKNCSLITLVLSCTVAAGVQFGWALQLSLLTPYIQTLGIGHAFSSFIWLCGPITGLVVQPCVGIWSDKCSSKFGRRRPFILLGSLMISLAVIIIGFSADIGYLIGDTKEHCSTFKGTRTRAAFVFILGFWMLDLANNTVQASIFRFTFCINGFGPARALLADLAGDTQTPLCPDQRNSANAIFCSWMAIGNILGFSSGSSGKWHRWFPFLTNRACCEACGNLKAAFLVAVLFLTFCTMVTLYFAKEVPLVPKQHLRLSDAAPLLGGTQQHVLDHSESKPRKNAVDHKVGVMSESVFEMDNSVRNEDLILKEEQVESFSESPGAVLVNLLTSLRHLPVGMHSVLAVMALTWVSSMDLSWFPFFLFDTDWMGREVYHGDPKGDAAEISAYDDGVREGAFGLLLNSVVLGISSFFIEPMCQWIGSKFVWAVSNFIVFACMAGTAIITLISLEESRGIDNALGGNEAIKTASLVVFAILGLPLAITYSVPFSVTADLTADTGGGQGLIGNWSFESCNRSTAGKSMIVSLGAGPWDALFGGGNVPAFVLASLSALAAGIIATIKLPTPSNSYKPTGFHFG